MAKILELAQGQDEFTGRGRYRTGKEHNSLVIDTVRNSFFWNSRSISGGPLDWLIKVEGLSREQALARLGDQPAYCPLPPKPPKLPKKEGPTPEQLASLTTKAEFHHGNLTPEARAYWHAQGINDASIDHFKLGFIARRSISPKCKAYTIPYWEAGRVVNLRQRLEDDSRGRYRGEFAGLGNSLFNIDGLARQGGLMKKGQAVLFEGEKKAIVGHQVGFKVAGIAGKNTWESRFVEHFKAAAIGLVYIALDPGAEAVAHKIANDFTAAGIRAIISRLPDKPDDLIMSGMTPAALLLLIKGLKPIHLSNEAGDRRDRIKAESKAEREARATELAQRREADQALLFLGEEEITPEEVRKARAVFTSAKKWADHCALHWPDLDAERQRQIKLQENREARPNTCGEEHWRTLPNGEVKKITWICGICDRCLNLQVDTYRRALNEIQGIANLGELDDELKEALQADDPIPGRRGEPAPPLERVHGPLSVLTIESDPERIKFSRTLRRRGVSYRCLPVEKDKRLAYDFILNSDEWGDPLGVMAIDERLKRWVVGFRGKRASGKLLPCLKSLEARYREPLPYEIVMPEMEDDETGLFDENGEPITKRRPVDPDIFCLAVPSIGTIAKLPEVAVDFEVNDAASLQAALLSIHKEQLEILVKKRVVIYGVEGMKKFYTRKTTLSSMISEFNSHNEAVKSSASCGGYVSKLLFEGISFTS